MVTSVSWLRWTPRPGNCGDPATVGRRPSAVSKSGHRLWRWPGLDTALGSRPCRVYTWAVGRGWERGKNHRLYTGVGTHPNRDSDPTLAQLPRHRVSNKEALGRGRVGLQAFAAMNWFADGPASSDCCVSVRYLPQHTPLSISRRGPRCACMLLPRSRPPPERFLGGLPGRGFSHQAQKWREGALWVRNDSTSVGNWFTAVG